MLDKEYFLNRIVNELGIENHRLKLFSIFSYGSRVYGNYDEHSDYDFIIVRRQLDYKVDTVRTKDNLINCTIYSPQGFQKAIDEHVISVLECLSLPDDMIVLNNKEWSWKLDLTTLRNSISQASSNSWVKAKKKLDDDEDYIAQKSLYHSMRMIMFGKQIASTGKISDFTESNDLWKEIQGLDLDWKVWKNKYQEKRNNLLSEFRLIAPK
jgi:hypothetical protein